MWPLWLIAAVFILGVTAAFWFTRAPRGHRPAHRSPLTRVLGRHDRTEADIRRRDSTGAVRVLRPDDPSSDERSTL